MRLGDGAGHIPAQVALAEHLGSETILHLDVPDGSTLVVRADGLARTKQGDRVSVGLPPEACHVFDAEGRTLHNGSLL